MDRKTFILMYMHAFVLNAGKINGKDYWDNICKLVTKVSILIILMIFAKVLPSFHISRDAGYKDRQ